MEVPEDQQLVVLLGPGCKHPDMSVEKLGTRCEVREFAGLCQPPLPVQGNRAGDLTRAAIVPCGYFTSPMALRSFATIAGGVFIVSLTNFWIAGPSMGSMS